MAHPQLRDRVVMECLEGNWEALDGNQRCRFRGMVRLTMTSIDHPEQPARTLQQPMEWILPTPTLYLIAEPIQVVEVSSPEEDPEEDPEEEPEEIHPEPTIEAQGLPKIDEDLIIDVDSPEEATPILEAESTEESGPGWLVESDDLSGGDGHSESTPVVQVPSHSSQSSSKFVGVPDIDVSDSSDDASVILPSDSTSIGDTDELIISDSSSQ